MTRFSFAAGLLALTCALIPGVELRAKDYFLTIGGGYNPSANQLSIETNVLFFQDMLADQRPDRPSHDVFFADGADQQRDLQYRDAESAKTCPPARCMMAELFGEADSVGLRYRNHQVRDVRGPTEANMIGRRFRELGRQLAPGDRLIVYVDGHGGEAYGKYDYDYEKEEWVDKGSDNGQQPLYNQYNTSIYLWNGESIDAGQFNRWLDRISPEVSVILVMGQCHAGGFSHAIFHRNDAELGLAPHARCGFFAQVHDRPAAGCTPDDDIEEYSSFLWSALGGRTRSGESVTEADFDGNGRVSFAEAHAYAILNSETFDIPVSTSGALLRRYSRLGGARGGDASDEAQEGSGNPLAAIFGAFGSSPGESTGPELLAASGPLSRLAAEARPEQRAILEGLAGQLGLEKTATVESVRLKLRQLQFAHGAAQAQLGLASETLGAALSDAQEEVRALWPELQTTYSPAAAALMDERADEFVAGVSSLAAYNALGKARQRVEDRGEKALRAQCEQAKAERLLQTIDEIALAANLPKVAPPEIVVRHRKIVALEAGGLAAPDAGSPTVEQAAE